MKKIIIFIVTLSFLLVSCGNTITTNNSSLTDSSEKESSTQTTSIEQDLELTGYQTSFNYGKDFNSTDLKAYLVEDGNRTDVTSDIEIDSTSYNPFKVGTYTINVTYNDLSKNYNVEVVKAKSLKILMIGHSFSEDCVTFANEVALSLGIDKDNLQIATIFYSGCSLEQHVNFARGNEACYSFLYFDGEKLVKEDNKYINDALEYTDWDFITFQQAPAACGDPTTFEQLGNLVSYVSKHIDCDAKFAWHMTWSYEQGCNLISFDFFDNDEFKMYEAIVNTTLDVVCKENGFDLVIPNATSIQNARGTKVVPSFNRDGYHLSLDYGRYVAAMTLVCYLGGYEPSEVTYRNRNIDPEHVEYLQWAVREAINNPFQFTQFDE